MELILACGSTAGGLQHSVTLRTWIEETGEVTKGILRALEFTTKALIVPISVEKT
jgi:hypothetical protein